MVIGADTLFRFRARQFTGRFGDGALDGRMMRLHPGPYGAADMPGGMVPDDAERLCAVGGPAGRPPPEKLGRDQTDRPPIDKTDQHGLGICTQPAIAGERWAHMGAGGIRTHSHDGWLGVILVA